MLVLDQHPNWSPTMYVMLCLRPLQIYAILTEGTFLIVLHSPAKNCLNGWGLNPQSKIFVLSQVPDSL